MKKIFNIKQNKIKKEKKKNLKIKNIFHKETFFSFNSTYNQHDRNIFFRAEFIFKSANRKKKKLHGERKDKSKR